VGRRGAPALLVGLMATCLGTKRQPIPPLTTNPHPSMGVQTALVRTQPTTPTPMPRCSPTGSEADTRTAPGAGSRPTARRTARSTGQSRLSRERSTGTSVSPHWLWWGCRSPDCTTSGTRSPAPTSPTAETSTGSASRWATAPTGSRMTSTRSGFRARTTPPTRSTHAATNHSVGVRDRYYVYTFVNTPVRRISRRAVSSCTQPSHVRMMPHRAASCGRIN
jgi:hypothetical protein